MKLDNLTAPPTKASRNAMLGTLRRMRSLVEEFRNDTEAECRWWNELAVKERLAYVGGAQRPSECAVSDWLDIGESNRREILNAAHAVQCWLLAISGR